MAVTDNVSVYARLTSMDIKLQDIESQCCTSKQSTLHQQTEDRGTYQTNHYAMQCQNVYPGCEPLALILAPIA